MATSIKKFKFTIEQVSNVQFDTAENKITFTIGDETQEVFITPKEDSSRIEFIEFADNKLLSLKEIADSFNLPEIITAAGSSPDTNGLSQYDDDAGKLIEGIDKLGKLKGLGFEQAHLVAHEESFITLPKKVIIPRVSFSPDTTEVFESHLDHGTKVVHGEVVDQDDSYTKATGHFDVTGVVGEYKGEATFSIGDESVAIDLPEVGESCTKSIGEDTYTITQETKGHFSYEYSLNSPKDHSQAPTDAHGDRYIDTHIHISITDPSGETVIVSGDMPINIIDDGVTALNPDVIVFTPSNEYYVSIALDISGSMSGWPLQLAKNALITLMEEYIASETETHVNLVLFSSGASLVGGIESPQDVINFLKDFNYAGGMTNYSAALNIMEGKVLTGLEHPDYTNQVLFISDGYPNMGGVTQSWRDLVTGEHSKELDVFSIGIGGAIGAGAQAQLESICNPEELGQDTGDMYVHVSDIKDLAEVLHDITNITSGNLAANNVLGADGVDKFYGFVDENNIEHKIDWSGETDVLDKKGYYTIYLAGDENSRNSVCIRINEHGDYVLRVHGEIEDATYNNIKLILEDNDGDKITLTGTVEITLSNGEVHHVGEYEVDFHHGHGEITNYDHIFDATTREVDIFSFPNHDHSHDNVQDPNQEPQDPNQEPQAPEATEHTNNYMLESGSNLINNFTLGEDKIHLEDILSEEEPLTLDTIMSHLEDGSWIVNEPNAHSSEITISHGEDAPTVVDINFDADIFTSNELSLEEQALFLLRLANASG